MIDLNALLFKADEIEKLETQVEVKKYKLSRLRKLLNLYWNCCEQPLKDNDVLTCDACQSIRHLKD